MPTARLAPMSRLTRRVSYCAGGLHANPPGAVASTHSGWRAMLQSVCPATAPPNSVSTKLGWEPVWAATDWGGGKAASRTNSGPNESRRIGPRRDGGGRPPDNGPGRRDWPRCRPGLRRQPYDRDRPRLPQQLAKRLRREGRGGQGAHAPGRWTCGVPLTARPTSTIPDRCAMVRASVDGTLGVATHARPARDALNANSAEMRPVTRRPRPPSGSRASTAAPITLSTAL